MQEKHSSIFCYISDNAERESIDWISERFNIKSVKDYDETGEKLALRLDAEGLSLVRGKQSFRGDFSKMLSRLKENNLNRELLVKAAKIKGASYPLTALDATAGMGEDALLLAAAGFSVKLYERDVVIAALLKDTLNRALREEKLAFYANRMQLFEGDSVTALSESTVPPDVVFLDPMFPSRQKSGLIKKKFQLLQDLEQPCEDEEILLNAALSCKPKRVVIKRPINGAYLAAIKPSYSLKGSTVRYDCILVQPDKSFA